MRKKDIKKILSRVDDLPLPPKEKILAACETSFHEIPIQKTKKSEFKPIAIKKRVLQYAAMAACLCLLITGVFGGLGLWRQGQTGLEIPAITSPSTQKGPDLPIGSYPPEQVDYENMSMVEYMELHPDFLSYRYMPWEENFAFAHLEILSVEEGYRQIADLQTDGTYDYYNDPGTSDQNYRFLLVKCRVIKDYWNALEEGSEINLFIETGRTVDYKQYDGEYSKDVIRNAESLLMRLEIAQYHIYDNKDGHEITEDVAHVYVEKLGCFPIVDGKISLEELNRFLNQIGAEPWYDIGVGGVPVVCSFSDVENILAEGMTLETAAENLSMVYAKYQTGEYNHVDIDLVSKMNYGEYVRLVNQESTDEDFRKYGTEIRLAYLLFPKEESRDIILSNGTVYPIFTVFILCDEDWSQLISEVAEIEKVYTDENGVLDEESCIAKIKKRESFYNLLSVLNGTLAK